MAILTPTPAPAASEDEICPCCKWRKAYGRSDQIFKPLEELEAASRNGCLRCKIVVEAVRAVCRSSVGDGKEMIQFSNISEVELLNRNSMEKIEIFALPGKCSTEVEGIPTKILLPDSTDSEKTRDTIRDWIRECNSSHKACEDRVAHKQGKKRVFPKRFLDLQHSENVRLVEDIQPSHYACLSHCWGYAPGMIKTEVETLSRFKDRIPKWELNQSKTFTDAIKVCRDLAIDFLWIDSLCIIQDSMEDWKAEAVKMADVYEDAAIVIAAMHSQNPNGGCYSNDTYLNTSHPLPSFDGLYARTCIPTFSPDYPFFGEYQPPLLRRGWAFQELLLSRRTVHFCAREVVWDCCTLRTSQSLNTYRYYIMEKWTRQEPSSSSSAQVCDNLIRLWHETVENYSRRALTFHKDRLPALAAVSQRMHAWRTKDKFLAGLWEQSLLSDLLWKNWGPANPPASVKSRLDPLRLPTWSWASITTGVCWPVTFYDERVFTHILEVDFVAAGSQYLGETARASLVMSGRLIPGHLRIIEENRDSDSVWGSTKMAFDSLDSWLGWDDTRKFRDALGDLHFNPDYQLSRDGDRPLFLLPVRSDDKIQCHCLVLREAPSEIARGRGQDFTHGTDSFGSYVDHGIVRPLSAELERIGALCFKLPERDQLFIEWSEGRMSKDEFDIAVKTAWEQLISLLDLVLPRTFCLV